MAVRHDLSMVRGDTFGFGMRLTNLEGVCVAGIAFTIRKAAAENPIVVQKSIGNGVTPGPDGWWRVRVAPEDTAGIEAGRYNYDLQINIGQDVYTPINGRIRIEQDVTW